MDFLEKDLEDIIFNADKEALIHRGLHAYGHIKLQLRIGNYGISDLVTFNRCFDDYEYCENKKILKQHLYI